MSKKKAQKARVNQFVFRSGASIGHLDAESDKIFLDNAFVEKEELDILKNASNSNCILVGRTGSGKTAFLSSLENDSKIELVRIEPEAMSLRYVSNSDIINYFEKLNIKLDLVYKTLWKHVFIVEFLKMYCGSSIDRTDNLWSIVFNFFSSKNALKKTAETYLEKWKDSFWQNTEYKIREIETSLLKKLSEAFKFNLPFAKEKLLELSSQYESQASESMKADILHKSQNVIKEMQVEGLNEVINVMKHNIFDERQGKYFVIIDDLDKEWVDKKLVYDLIRAMIEAIKEINSIGGIKVVIAIRENLLKLVLNSRSRGNQREKYDSVILRINWSREELYELLEKRLKYFYKEKYTSQAPRFEDIFKLHQAGANNAFEYMLERTLMRPRDLINFTNICIKNANGKTEINSDIIKLSEREYSKSRLDAIQDEWVENYPLITETIHLLRATNESFSYDQILSKANTIFSETFVSNLDNSIQINSHTQSLIEEYRRTMDANKLLKENLIIFYEMGLIGIKAFPDEPYEFSHNNNNSTITESSLNSETKMMIHKMFQRGLNTNLRNND